MQSKKLLSGFTAIVVKIIVLLPCVNCTAQFQIGHTTMTFIDPSRGNRAVETEIYYPADVAGDDTTIAFGIEKFPIIAFGHGFLMGWNAYENIWTAVVPQGFIMAFPKTE